MPALERRQAFADSQVAEAGRPGPAGRRRAALVGTLTAFALIAATGARLGAQLPTAPAYSGQPGLVPTAHPPVPSQLHELWLVPSTNGDAGALPGAPTANLVRAARLAATEQHREAVLLIDPDALASTPLAGHARYLLGTSLAALGRHDEAIAQFAALGALAPVGALAREWHRGAAKSAEVVGDHRLAASHYEALVGNKPWLSAEALDGLARVLTVLGERERAAASYARLDLEFPASPLAAHARSQASELAAITGQSLPRSFGEELARAERLVAARAYGDARLAFERLLSSAEPTDRPLVALRLASVNLAQRRFAQTVALAAPHRREGDKQDEAGYLWAMGTRRVGRAADFVAEVQRLAREFPESRWTERALDELATHHLVHDQDEAAFDVFRQITEQFPEGPSAERAYWRYGWHRYRSGDFAAAVSAFDRGAAAFPRSDYRPAYLYWSGRGHAKLGNADVARARLQVAVADYGNSYYGRLASSWVQQLSQLETRPAVETRLASVQQVPVTPDVPPLPSAPVQADRPPISSIPNEALVRQLLSLELYDAALLELDYAKTNFGPAPAIDATIAWVQHRQGDLRRGINTMKRAYPQYMASNGDALPLDVQRVLYPLQYWDLIQQHARERGLDPYLVAALVAQESTFQADVKSSANAYGLMQIIPSTGRRLARLEGVKNFTTRSLVNPSVNVQLGTAYFARLIERFEHPHLALAGYNAGDSRVIRWTAERSALPADEFIEDIPFPETQNYVKRILGTASDYRRVYGELGGQPIPGSSSAPPAASVAASAATKSPAAKGAAPKRPAPKPPTKATATKKAASSKAAPNKATSKKTAPKKVAAKKTASKRAPAVSASTR